MKNSSHGEANKLGTMPYARFPFCLPLTRGKILLVTDNFSTQLTQQTPGEKTKKTALTLEPAFCTGDIPTCSIQ